MQLDAPEIGLSTLGKVGLWALASATVVWAIVKAILQPLATTWLFFTLGREKARFREVVEETFHAPLAELATTLREIRDCQADQSRELGEISGYLKRQREED